MKSKTLLLVLGFLAGFGVGVFVWQKFVATKLATENQQLRAEAGKVAALSDENARLASERVDPAELKRLREGQAELIRLRGQAGQLRREAQEAKTAAAASARAVAQASAAAPTAQPTNEVSVTTYTANAVVRVGWQMAAATGGWQLPSGKRGFVLLMPSDPGDGSVNIRSLVVQVPENLLASAGLDGLKADGNAGKGSGNLTPEQLQVLTSSFRKKEGVEITGGPNISVLSGNQGQITDTVPFTLPSGQTYNTGTAIEVTPTITPDKQGVEIVVGAQVNLPRTQP
jgi:hypothetical protein